MQFNFRPSAIWSLFIFTCCIFVLTVIMTLKNDVIYYTKMKLLLVNGQWKVYSFVGSVEDIPLCWYHLFLAIDEVNEQLPSRVLYCMWNKSGRQYVKYSQTAWLWCTVYWYHLKHFKYFLSMWELLLFVRGVNILFINLIETQFSFQAFQSIPSKE